MQLLPKLSILKKKKKDYSQISNHWLVPDAKGKKKRFPMKSQAAGLHERR